MPDLGHSGVSEERGTLLAVQHDIDAAYAAARYWRPGDALPEISSRLRSARTTIADRLGELEASKEGK